MDIVSCKLGSNWLHIVSNTKLIFVFVTINKNNRNVIYKKQSSILRKWFYSVNKSCNYSLLTFTVYMRVKLIREHNEEIENWFASIMEDISK